MKQNSSKQLDFTLVSVSHLSSTTAAVSSLSSPSSAVFSVSSGVVELLIHQDSEPNSSILIDLCKAKLFKLSPVESICVSEYSGDKEASYAKGVSIRFRNEEESKAFHCAFEQLKKEAAEGLEVPNGMALDSKSKFDAKTEASSAKMYFHYYGQLLHQQNMMQDYVRTGTYYAAVMENRVDFTGKVVVDVGAGSGILSLFAAQGGAKHVYAVEASEMAEYARKLIAGNPFLAERITVIKGKIEEVELPEKADLLISEPMGTLLVNERMLESYIIARDRFLVPMGKMFPGVGRIHMAPFSDEHLFVEIASKALEFVLNTSKLANYKGVNIEIK